MSTKTTLTLSAIAAIALAFVVGPALIQAASAVPAEKQVVVDKCSEEKFADRESCPGKSEDATGNPGDREDIEECTARNNGQAKDCPPDSKIIIVNGNPQ